MRQLFTVTSPVTQLMNSISDRFERNALSWLPVIILLRFAHVIFIEINVDKIINAFTKNFL